jgi:hypothetical protein
VRAGILLAAAALASTTAGGQIIRTANAAPTPAATPNTNCTLIVPPAPLTAAGLATPYRLTATDPGAGRCQEANTDQSAFVEAAIIDPATGKLSIYHPLVVDDGTQAAVPPVRPDLPPQAVVGIWFGFQADTLSLRTDRIHHPNIQVGTAAADNCVNGLAGSPFGQFAYCNAPGFFAAANAAIRAGKLVVPPLGTAVDGRPCPSTRDFSVVDQDQSDNLPTRYLALPNGRTAQFSRANIASLTGATVLSNASDNGLLNDRIGPALKCRPFTAPDLSAGGTPSASLALNELQAAAHQNAPVALVPPNDPMTQLDGHTSVLKTNLYRAGVNMPPMDPATDTGAAYCTNLATVASARLQLDQPWTSAAASPDPAAGANLFDFLTQRLTASWTELDCKALTKLRAPVVGASTARKQA